ncbi:UPF0317 protein Arth_3576 [Arthrobacter sp. Hiyo4]|nr:UPF0317 protein Arth_3576 [Arthrobacter sp. Hiyo4]
MVVSMRPMLPELVETAIRVTPEVPKVHGSPVHVGSPEDLGIADINHAPGHMFITDVPESTYREPAGEPS